MKLNPEHFPINNLSNADKKQQLDDLQNYGQCITRHKPDGSVIAVPLDEVFVSPQKPKELK